MGQPLQHGYDLLSSHVQQPLPHCCDCSTHHQLTTLRGTNANSASPPAEQRQLLQRHHPGTSLPVLAISSVSVPVPGLAHHFQSLELDRPQISKKPSVITPSLLQLHFTTGRGICHHPWSSRGKVCSAQSRPWRAPAHSDPVCKERNHQFYPKLWSKFMHSTWQDYHIH